MLFVDLETGKWIVKFARKVIEKTVRGEIIEIPKGYPKTLNEKRGVFVTILTYPDRELRGCIGLPYPTHPLIEGIVEAASQACFDPRFPPLKEEELKDVVIEVSILTKPQEIAVNNPMEYLEKIKIGEDGLMLISKYFSGLLLPQVPVEYNWDVRTFLENLCLKANLPKDCWMSPDVKIYKFQAEIFEEKSPNGEVGRKKINNP
ncbi:MAG: TIGR00296 family protein [Candidatus Aenigmarchaeota archaeon]|nr:TIGR00296 family protein [Candidatus Aenigmarchaeota archaeon]